MDKWMNGRMNKPTFSGGLYPPKNGAIEISVYYANGQWTSRILLVCWGLGALEDLRQKTIFPYIYLTRNSGSYSPLNSSPIGSRI